MKRSRTVSGRGVEGVGPQWCDMDTPLDHDGTREIVSHLLPARDVRRRDAGDVGDVATSQPHRRDTGES